MTQKEEKEWSKMVPRFKEVCCSRMCNCWEQCKNNETHSFLACPWFFGYRVNGWPVKRLSDFSYNAPKLPDLRIEEADDDTIKKWKSGK